MSDVGEQLDYSSHSTQHQTRSVRSHPRGETTSLLGSNDSQQLDYHTTPPRHRQLTYSQSLRSRTASRRGSLRYRLEHSQYSVTQPETPLRSSLLERKTWYDQFTSTDWIRDAIADAERVRSLRARRDWRGRLQVVFDGAQGWVLVAIIGILTAAIAYLIDIVESTIFDYKIGYCRTKWWYNKRLCCNKASICDEWAPWSILISKDNLRDRWLDFAIYIAWVIVLAMLACLITLLTKTSISSHVTLSTLDENLGAEDLQKIKHSSHDETIDEDHDKHYVTIARSPTKTYYPAAGSGVAEVKVILSGFVLHGYLGVRTLLCKSIGLILSVSSGLSIGKEGPYVHIATCIGNIASRMFEKYNLNDAKRREVLSASAAAGVAVAFGSPIGGVLFSLEEVSYYFPPKTLFRTFFCCIVAALSLKFLDPYGTSKIVLFEVRYLTDWRLFEIAVFILLGIIGGTIGALFIKASRIWAKSFRRVQLIKNRPALEVLLVAVITGIVSYWNRYTRLPIAELLYELAAPCNSFSDTGVSLCATQERIPEVIRYLSLALLAKTLLTVISFGIKVPAGIYVPSMVIGGMVGRIAGHAIQYMVLTQPSFAYFVGCASDGNPESCIVPGVYALVAAGATMCGVTRLSVTLAVILFELTGSLEHVLPFSLGVLGAKWTADAIEPSSIYDLLMGAYPYLDTKARPVFTSELEDITPSLGKADFIDISESAWIPATQLRQQLQGLQLSGEIDGGFPIVQGDVLKGLIPAPDLEYALDSLESEDDVVCYMNPHIASSDAISDYVSQVADTPFGLLTARSFRKVDFSGSIDPAPVALDICSPMDLIFECFAKLGLRYVCILREGRFMGLIHKKKFVKHVKDTHEQERHRSHKKHW